MSTRKGLLGISFFTDLGVNVILFLVTPLLLYFYDSAVIGTYAKFQATVTLCSVFSSFRLELGIDKRHHLHSVMLQFIHSVGLISCLLVSLIVNLCLQVFFEQSFTLFDWAFIALGAWLFGLLNYYTYLYVYREDKYGLIISKVIRVLSLVSFQIGVSYAFQWFTYDMLIYSFIGSLSIFYLFSAYRMGRYNLIKSGGYSFAAKVAELKDLVVNYRELMVNNVPSALVITLQDFLVVSVITSESKALAGYYFIADRLLRTPVNLINNNIRQFILMRKLSVTRKGLFGVFSFFVAINVIFFSGWEYSIDFVNSKFGEEVTSVVSIFAKLAIIYSASVILSISSSHMILIGKSKFVLLYCMVLLLVTILAIVLAGFSYFSFINVYTVCATFVMLGFSLFYSHYIKIGQ